MTLRDHLGVPYADEDQEVVVLGNGSIGYFSPGHKVLVPTGDLSDLDAIHDAGQRAALFAADESSER